MTRKTTIIVIFLFLFFYGLYKHLSDPRENDYENFLAKSNYADTLLSYFHRIYIPIYSVNYSKSVPNLENKSLEIFIKIDSTLQISNNSIFMLSDGYRLIFDGKMNLYKKESNLKVFQIKTQYFYKYTYGNCARIDLMVFDTAHKSYYNWGTEEIHAVYEAEKITIKCDQYSTCVAKLDNDWFYK